MNKWISVLDKDGEPKNMIAPDGTIIEIHNDKNIVITPDGYRVQIDLYPPSFLVLDRIYNNNSKEIYEKYLTQQTD